MQLTLEELKAMYLQARREEENTDNDADKRKIAHNTIHMIDVYMDVFINNYSRNEEVRARLESWEKEFQTA